ncbi:uncharacterized protein FIBRA_02026 [Fibroporia radiculosa]|uniref:Enhancer of polycomb-like protein n=1 Tax=Fibroporia radiculosa TaxID=599839 RepID=J4I8U1_9APHY|nr:uncharacterized protein FIBRA_02026 [Fibroporia radiculosa]CCM00001.1 predicted protein [Fibroporia radiculosa]
MPRNHNAGPSTLRNRNRVTNKTRLKVITESIDADPIVLDEDEEKARVVSTAGVDAEDANEHHLQAVLSAAATRHQANVRATRSEKEKVVSAAYIPTPDSTGVVDNYEELYPSDRWKDSATYVKSSDTVEESIFSALATGFIYYMDERDKDWLDKNNEEARGEGTSAQGAVSGTGTRSGRSSKAKGKDPEFNQPVAMSEDEFELVMAIFEKVTHEKTPFLYHGLEEGTVFPPFSDYQDTFAADLSASMFALFDTPKWIPSPQQLLRMARAVYPYWRDRRLERGGHPIIPSVNLDEADTKNESYICFRRREIKAIRKTRAQQATYSDKMLRLHSELATSLELARGVLEREVFKREAAGQSQGVWEKRLVLVDLKRKFPALGTKEEEELLYDKERTPKKPRAESTARIPLKLRTRDNGELGSPNGHQEPQIRPKERQAQIQSQIEQELAKRKEKDHHWEDSIDNTYQPSPPAYASKLFKFISSTRGSMSSISSNEAGPIKPSRSSRAARLRYGRGGRLHLDRRTLIPRVSSPSELLLEDEEGDVEARERARRLFERWKFDNDDGPAFGSEGPDERDRILLDDSQPRYLVHSVTLLNDQDYESFSPDTSITVTLNDGRPHTHIPFKLSPLTPSRRDVVAPARAGSTVGTSGEAIASVQSNGLLPMLSSGMPSVVPTPSKKMVPPSVPHVRISSYGEMRPPGLPTLPNMQPSSAICPPQSTPSSSTNSGAQDGSGSPIDADDHGTQPSAAAGVNGNAQVIQDHSQSDANSLAVVSSSPVRSKALLQQSISIPAVPNGYHIPPVNSFSTPMPATPYVHPPARHNGLGLQQQMQSIKSAFMLPSSDSNAQVHNANMQLRTSASYIGHLLPGNSNYVPQQLATARHMQQYLQQQRSPSIQSADVNGLEGMSVTPSLSPPMPGTPVRTPSANGVHTPLSRAGTVPAINQTQGRASPATTHITRLAAPLSPSPHLLNANLGTAQPQSSPSRSPQPVLASPSPSLQSRQAVGSSGAGY